MRADAAVTLAEKLRLSDNTGATGLVVGNGSMIKDCVASGNGTGFFAGDRTPAQQLHLDREHRHGFDCTSYVNAPRLHLEPQWWRWHHTQGGCSILRCSATRNLPNGKGILAGDGCTISDCTATNNGGVGITANAGSISNCTSNNNGSAGINGTAGSISNCTSNNNMGFGISTFKASITNCTARNNFDYDIGAYSSAMAFLQRRSRGYEQHNSHRKQYYPMTPGAHARPSARRRICRRPGSR